MIEDIAGLCGTRLGPGTLYGAIARLEQQGWIEPLPPKRTPPAVSHYCARARGSARKTENAATVHPGRMEKTGSSMNPTLARILTRLYPRQWRERYERNSRRCCKMATAVFELQQMFYGRRFVVLVPTVGSKMDEKFSFGGVVRKPSAFVPLAMSLTALAVVLSHIAIYGAVREPDEGTAAHIWQLLMGLQLPILAFFAIKWLPKAPRQTLIVLGMQAGAALRMRWLQCSTLICECRVSCGFTLI